MNTQAHIRQFASRLTSKYQATIPKEIRDALGLKAGDRVRFELTDEGYAAIVPADQEETVAARKAQIMEGVREARRIYKSHGVPLGMSNAEYFEMMRGPSAEK